jgi:hypothetical protein
MDSATTVDGDDDDCFLRFISEDALRYHFQSRKNPNIWWTVDLAWYDYNGKCSCPNFEIKREPLLRSRTIKPNTPRAECRHITRAKRILVRKTIEFLDRSRNPNRPDSDED